MPVVDIKGVGKAQFPDDMPPEKIREFLRYKYPATTGNPLLMPQQNMAAPVEKTLMERAGQGVSDFLYDNDIVSDRYGAQRIGGNLATLGEFLPGIGDVAAADEFGRAAAQGDKLGMGLASLGAIPIAGDALKRLPMDLASRMERANQQGFDAEKVWYHGTKSDFDEFGGTGAMQNRTTGSPVGVSFFSSDPDVADSYTSGRLRKGQSKNIVPVNVIDNAVEIDTEKGSTWSQMVISNPDLDIKLKNPDNPKGWEWRSSKEPAKESSYYDAATGEYVFYKDYPELTDTNEMSRLMRDAGYDSAIFKGISDGKTKKAANKKQDTLAVFKPENIRSTSAKFDPENKGSANILGGLGALGLYGMYSDKQQGEDK